MKHKYLKPENIIRENDDFFIFYLNNKTEYFKNIFNFYEDIKDVVIFNEKIDYLDILIKNNNKCILLIYNKDTNTVSGFMFWDEHLVKILREQSIKLC